MAGAPPDVGNPPPRALLGAIDRFVAGKTVPRCAGLDSKAQVDAASLWELVQRIGGTAHELGEFGEKRSQRGVLLHREEHYGRCSSRWRKPPPRAMFSAVDKSAASQIVIRCADSIQRSGRRRGLLADLYEASTGQSMGWSFRRDRGADRCAPPSRGALRRCSSRWRSTPAEPDEAPLAAETRTV